VDALEARGAVLTALLRRAPAERLDEIAERIDPAERAGVLAELLADALARPAELLEVCIWLWRGPAVPPPEMPSKVDLLMRLLSVLQEWQREWDADRDRRRQTYQRVRAALSGRDYAAYEAALGQMDAGVAGTLRRRIERLDGLAAAVRQEMLDRLLDRHASAFQTTAAPVAPWEDDSVVYTTQAARDRRQDELRHIQEIEMPANSRAIGVAADHGDLSENAEWKFAIEEQQRLQQRAAKLQDELARARILDPEDVPTGEVGIGSRVRLRAVDGQGDVELSILGPWDSDVDSRVYSYGTPLAKALLGKGVGETVTLKLDGRESEWTIVHLGSAVM